MTIEGAAWKLLHVLKKERDWTGTEVAAHMRELQGELEFEDEALLLSTQTFEVHPDCDLAGAPHDMIIGPCKCGAWHGPGEISRTSIRPAEDDGA